jgi:hypothetical protein
VSEAGCRPGRFKGGWSSDGVREDFLIDDLQVTTDPGCPKE